MIPETLSGAQRAEEQIRSGTGEGRGGGVGIKGTKAWNRMIPVVEGKALGSSERLKPSAVIGSDLEPMGHRFIGPKILTEARSDSSQWRRHWA